MVVAMFTRALYLEVAAEALVDWRSVEAELNGRRVRGQAGIRIRNALARRRLISVAAAPGCSIRGMVEEQARDDADALAELGAAGQLRGRVF
jgi:hypothetical protein